MTCGNYQITGVRNQHSDICFNNILNRIVLYLHFCFLTDVFFNMWKRVSDISHVFSFFFRLLYLILFPELLTSTSFIAKGLCSILLFLPMYNLSLSTKTKLYNSSVGIQEKCFLGVCSSLYATHTEQKQKKKPKNQAWLYLAWTV